MRKEKESINSRHSDNITNPIDQEDETDIFDILNQLWAGKKVILLTTIFCLLLASIYIFTAKEKWTSEAIISQPSAGEVALYNNALTVLYTQNIQDKIALPDLQKQIFNRYSSSAYALSGTLKNLVIPLQLDVTQTTKGKDDPLTISFTDSSAEKAQQKLFYYINQLNAEVSDNYAVDMRTNILVKENGLKDSLTTQEKIAQDKKLHRIEVIKQSLKIAEAAKISSTQLNQAEYLSDDTLYLLGTSALTSMIANENSKPLVLDDYYYESQRTLLALNRLRIDFSKMNNFEFIKKPDLPIYRDSPKKSLTLVLAIVLGGVMGACIVILRNMSKYYSQRKSK